MGKSRRNAPRDENGLKLGCELGRHVAARSEPARISPVDCHPRVVAAPVAQLVEQRTLNPWVQGSSPCGGTLFSPHD